MIKLLKITENISMTNIAEKERLENKTQYKKKFCPRILLANAVNISIIVTVLTLVNSLAENGDFTGRKRKGEVGPHLL